ncbi:MAG: hypothetical protein COW73_00580 [Nitrospirae bacterium CG18_big_fil_WC_8_21_14_2_50_70_55]|nr:hypothetical protein [Deltaproteobacteria bacterium]OIP66361.1 MAG: hypothetical protein AUK30_02665 [Nitrospirae bacterium CG2_30_70_394]PIQ07221.1 MAG: hypothetical protein COW73_00580 [Nitrospirae bacterium CG18_big_fil_WC_8_21_14_2_50_70_55]PIU78494.1 MAG: hypothetical protein COS73_07055 [Nitrospirae bacterium CG06_land_8_20_14_3_00_70_43]PIW83213.1 MAG: hypothetical protein COZ96_04640 [Nitrospirae bacterium CG_4_8_14_3_um_filter_70_85]PJB95667.1 MAG: hypothetical protein CO080_06510 
MSLAALLGAPLRYRLLRPRHLALIVGELVLGGRRPAGSHLDHLDAAVGWLSHAQEVRDRQPDAGGVAAGWSFADGWLPSYPETSGYIVETLVAAAAVLERPTLTARAHRILDWELSIQRADGAFPGHFGEQGSAPVVFNTGQILHGMVTGALRLGRADCLAAAVRAGHWLASFQDEDGCWRTHVHNGCPHTYNSRAAWAVARAGAAAGDAELRAVARRNLEWALSQQTASGWFATNAFTPERDPFTHTIAYAIRGLLEGGLLLGEERCVAAATRAARALVALQRDDGSLAGTFADGWRPTARYCCLTGLAQMAINWLRLAEVTDDVGLVAPARRAIAYLKRCHRRTGPPALAGAVAGSMPIWGGYSRFEFPNWAPKFFADALILDLGRHDLLVETPAAAVAVEAGR